MKILLVDDEEQVLKGVSRLIECEEDEWEVETAQSGEMALDILSQDEFDVVVSDMQMPSMDGAELLGKIEEHYPSILRVVLSGQAAREAVLRAVKPMHQYLSKPCNPDQLFEVINRARIFQETIKTTEVLNAIGQANCLPTFPEIVNDINRELESERCSQQTIADIVAKDPILSARILQVANSAIFALRKPVSDLDRAISWVGLDMLQAIALSHAVFTENDCQKKKMSMQNLMDHGFHVATLGKQLAKRIGLSNEDGNTIFMAGLLHDVGKLILVNAFPEKYSSILAQANQGKNLQELELSTFNATHQGIGGYLFSLWGLPLGVIEAVASHHSFESCAQCDADATRIVFAANWIARNRQTEELQNLVDNCEQAESAEHFASQIQDWQNFLNGEQEN